MQEKNARLVSHPRAAKNNTKKSHNDTKKSDEKRNEQERLAVLGRCLILDTPPEAAFDRITALAARLFEVPAAVISFVDDRRLWFKSCGGPACVRLPPEISREGTPCLCTLLSPDVLVVEDAQLDPRFSRTPLVTGPLGLRFYAGAPLTLPGGTTLGTLCLLDSSPRTFSQSQRDALRDLAASVVSEIELRHILMSAAQDNRLYRQMFADNPYPMWIFDAETLRFLDVNNLALTLYGYTRKEFLALSVLDIRPPEARSPVQAHLGALAAAGSSKGTRGIWRHQAKDGTLLWMEISSHSVEYGSRNARMAIAQDVSERCRTESALRRSEQKFSAHVQQMPLAALEISPEMTVLRWNPAAERIFGYTAAEAVGRSIAALSS